MTFDLILRGARILGREAEPADIGIAAGRIAAIAPSLPHCDEPEERLDSQLVLPGLVETHIHLDKSRIIDRCTISAGTVKEAIAETARAKAAFTEADIEARARHTLEQAILAGTQFMRTHVEVDPRIGLKSFHVLQKLKHDYSWALDLQLCVFPQEGLINDPGTEELLVAACEQGADLIGGCPYADTEPNEHLARIFALAQRFDLDIDLHLDFDLDPSWMHIDEVARLTEAHRWGGRVAAGHVTKLSAIPPDGQTEMARRLANAGIALTVLPATDLFLMGRDATHNVPRGVTRADKFMESGVTCSLATNNVLNPFTPFGDASLVRMANLYANIAQLGRPTELERCLNMITSEAAHLMNLDGYGIAVGNSADLIALPCASGPSAIAEIAQPLWGLKGGRRSFFNPPGQLLGPQHHSHPVIPDAK
jgi:cytosine/creatinine deaminase